MKRVTGLFAVLLIVGLGSCVGVPADRTPAPTPPLVSTSVAQPLRPAPPLAFVLEGTPRQGGVMRGTVPAGVVSVTLDGTTIPLAADRRFLLAFDRDAASRATLMARTANGQNLTRELLVAPGGWRIETINAPLRAGRSSAEFERLRPAEIALINAARARTNESDGWRQRFAWPATGRVSGLFGAQRVYQGTPGSYHSGVDVAVPTGTPVRAPADGVVILAADHAFTLEGNLLMIDHGMGLNSAFLHLSRIDVAEGDRVARGQVIGRVGATGRATGPHMHWGMKWQDARIDPALLAGPMGS